MEDDQQFCLRWNNHQSTLIQNFDTLLESGTLVDCTLAAEGKYLKAHKVVLSACSPYFEGLLSEHYDKHPVFILKDVKFKELKAMMDYMYRGEVNINQDQLTALLKAAESLQIKGLSDSRTGGGPSSGVATTAKTETRPAKTASSAVAASSSHDIPHASSGLTIEKNNKVPRQSLQQVSISDLPDDSASPHLRGLSSREGSQSPTRKRKRLRRRSLGNDDTNSMENHEASNSSDVNISAPALGVAPVAEDRTHADPADTVGRSALMQQLTKPADEMLQIPIEKPEPSDELIQPKSEYLDDQESVEELTNLDDDMNDLNDMDPDNSRAGPSHDPSQHGGLAAWHIAGDRSNASVVGAAAGAPGQQDEVFLAAQDAAQAQRDSQVPEVIFIDEEFTIDADKTPTAEPNADPLNLNITWVFRDLVKLYCPNCKEYLPVVYRKPLTECTKCATPLRFQCTKCDNFYNKSITAYKHARLDCQEKPGWRCTECDFVTRRKVRLLTHVKNKHTVIDPKNYPKCEHCGKRYKQYTRLRVHLKTCGLGIDKTEIFCKHCPQVFKRRDNLRVHMLNVHPEAESVKIYSCIKCKKKYRYLSSLETHVKSCGKKWEYVCDACHYRNTRRANLVRHLMRNHPEFYPRRPEGRCFN